MGDAAPTFELEAVLGDRERGLVNLMDQLRKVEEDGGKGVVVYFYPEASTPGCTAEACDFRDSLEDLQGAGYRVVGISPDDLDKIEKFHEDEGLTFPLASDPDNTVSTEFNVYGEHNVMGHKKVGVIRSTFVVGTDGTLTYVKRNHTAKGFVARLKKELGLE
ncbi:MAG TPA: peroxiredoxin [Actinomycetales bacterium]|nr:peroxiredoxin [Actinomycetales bacterium]